MRFVIAAFSLVLALAAPAAFAAGTVTFNNTGCADFTVTNNGGGNFTLTCVPVVGPVCVITPSTSSPAIPGSAPTSCRARPTTRRRR